MISFKQFLIEVKVPAWFEIRNMDKANDLPREILDMIKRDKKIVLFTSILHRRELSIEVVGVDEDKIYEIIKILDKHKINYKYHKD